MPNTRSARIPREYSPKYTKQRKDFEEYLDSFDDKRKENPARVDETNAEDVFKNLIQRDSSVCNHCFAEKYDVYVHEYLSSGSWRKREDREWSDKSGSVPRDLAGEGTRPTCECGYVYEHHRPVSVEDAVEFSRNLSNSLLKRGVDHDRMELISSVHSLARRPSNQHRQDQGVFQAAIAKSIK